MQEIPQMMSNKKNTGDTSYSDQVIAEKNATRDIIGRAETVEVGEFIEEDVGTNGVESSSGRQISVGNKERKRSEAAHGVQRKCCGEELLIHHVASVWEAVTELVKDMKKGAQETK